MQNISFYSDFSDISLKRIFRFVLAAVFVLFAISQIFGIGIASASDIGTIEVVQNTEKTYNPGSSVATLSKQNFSLLYLNTTFYDRPFYIKYKPTSGFVFNYTSYLWTPFQIVEGGSGSGYIYTEVFEDNTVNLTWIFNNDVTITNKSVVLNYDADQDIFNITFPNNNICGQNIAGHEAFTSQNEPAYFYCDAAAASNSHALNGNYMTGMQVIQTDSYNVSYITIQGVNKFIAVGSRGGNNPTRHNYTNITGSLIVTEPVGGGFGLNNYTLIANFTNGLVLNVSLSTGGYNLKVITNNGTGLIQVGNNTGGSSTGQIYYYYDQARLNSFYGINVSISNSNFTNKFRTFHIRVFKDCLGTICTEESGSPIEFSTQTYNTSKLWQFKALGTYYANLYYSEPWELGILNHLMDTATIVISAQQYDYNITADRKLYGNGETIRLTATNPSPGTVYINMFPQVGGSGQGQNVIVNQPIAPFTTKIINVTVTNNMIFGEWEAAMYTQTGSFGKVSFVNFTIGVPTAGSNRQGLRWGEEYVLGRTNNLYYTSNQNESTVKVFKTTPGTNVTFLNDQFNVSAFTSDQKPYLLDQTGLWIAEIRDGGNFSNVTYANITVFASQELTCNRNSRSFVCWNNQSYTKGQTFLITYKVARDIMATSISDITASRTGVFLDIVDPNGLVVINKTIGTRSISPTELTGSFSGTFTKDSIAGKWKATIHFTQDQFFGGTEQIQVAESFAYVASGTETNIGSVNDQGILTSPCKEGSPVCLFDGWVSLFGLGINDTSRFLFALIVICLVIVCGFLLTGSNSTGGIIMGFIPFAFFAYISYVPQYFTILMILIVVIKLRWFS